MGIPLAYLFLRLWDAVQVLGLSMTTLKEPLACANHDKQVASFVISILQVSVDKVQCYTIRGVVTWRAHDHDHATPKLILLLSTTCMSYV